MEIWLITVNYKNTDSTVALVKSLKKVNLNFSLKIFIADNDYSEISKNELTKLKKKSALKIEIFFFEENKFYWPAANEILLRKFDLKKRYPDWTIICNNDILFNDKFFFDKLFKYDGKLYNVIGPNIVTNDKKQLNPFMKNSMDIRKKLFWNLFFKSFYLSLFMGYLLKFKNFFNKNISNDKITKVYAVHGSAILFSNHFFKMGGELDSNFKLFCEELTTAEISKKIGCSVFFLPDLNLLHCEHNSTKRQDKRKLFRIAKESHIYFIRKYFKK